jgi:zinc transport system substrate-binding protein
MDKKKITIVLLSIASIGIVVFMAVDMWNSFLQAGNSHREKLGERQIVSQKIQVAVSFYPLYFFASQIAGDKATVVNIADPNSDPAKYNLTAQNITDIENSDLVIANNLGLETWFNDAKNIANASKNIFVAVSDGINENDLLQEGGSVDYHIWLSPKLAARIVDQILKGFLRADSQNEEFYKSNADGLKSKLSELDSKFKAGLENCQQKNIFGLSSALSYIARDYNLSQTLVSGIPGYGQFTESQLKKIADFISTEKAQFIFVENKIDPESIGDIEEKIGAKILIINLAQSEGTDYFSAMADDLENLRTALQCK